MAIWNKNELLLNESNISHERLDGEVILISFTSGKYFSAKGSGADLIWLIANKIPQSNWQSILSAEFNEFDANDSGIEVFIAKLIEEDLIIETSELLINLDKLPNDYSRSVWNTPTLTAFNDLQDLLLIDPIHDASLEGWPKTKNE